MTDLQSEKHPPDKRPPLVVGMEMATQITTIGLEMALPGFLGHWVDEKLGSGIIFLVLGVLVGFAIAMLHLARLVKQ